MIIDSASRAVFIWSKTTKGYPEAYQILISPEDHARVASYKWTPFQTRKDKQNGRIYFTAGVLQPDGTRKRIYLHRFIMGAAPGVMVDHRDPSKTLDNRRSNLRFATNEQNTQNARKRRNNNGEIAASQYKGVCRDHGKWKASIQAKGKRKRLGTFSLETQAARAYDLAALQRHGEFAVLNFPIEDYRQSISA